MSKLIPRALAVVLAALLLLAIVTWVSLESGGVLTVHTEAPDGSIRSTHIWFVEQSGGALWLEAGHPENPWVRDLQRASKLEIVGEGVDGLYEFEIRTDAESHQAIRRLMREKYGWRDGWVGALSDTSRSSLVALRGPTAAN